MAIEILSVWKSEPMVLAGSNRTLDWSTVHLHVAAELRRDREPFSAFVAFVRKLNGSIGIDSGGSHVVISLPGGGCSTFVAGTWREQANERRASS